MICFLRMIRMSLAQLNTRKGKGYNFESKEVNEVDVVGFKFPQNFPVEVAKTKLHRGSSQNIASF